MTYYLGKAGALLALPDPEVELSQSPERLGGTHQLLSGNKVRDTIGRMRTWNLSWTAIDLTTFGTLQGYYYGTVGAGPYYFVDPEQRNLLTADASSGTDITSSTAAFGWFGALTVASSTDHAVTGLRSLFVQFNGVVSARGAAIEANVPTAPVRPSTAYTAQLSAIEGGGTASMQVECRLIWYDSTHTYITENVGTAVVLSTGAFGAVTCTATSPSNAVYAGVRLTNAIATTTTTSVYADAWQLEQASTASAWVPGVGVPLVTVETLSCTTPLSGICDAQMTLVQVG